MPARYFFHSGRKIFSIFAFLKYSKYFPPHSYNVGFLSRPNKMMLTSVVVIAFGLLCDGTPPPSVLPIATKDPTLDAFSSFHRIGVDLFVCSCAPIADFELPPSYTPIWDGDRPPPKTLLRGGGSLIGGDFYESDYDFKRVQQFISAFSL